MWEVITEKFNDIFGRDVVNVCETFGCSSSAEKEAFDYGFRNAVLKNIEKCFSKIPSRRPANGLLGPEMVDPNSDVAAEYIHWV